MLFQGIKNAMELQIPQLFRFSTSKNPHMHHVTVNLLFDILFNICDLITSLLAQPSRALPAPVQTSLQVQLSMARLPTFLS